MHKFGFDNSRRFGIEIELNTPTDRIKNSKEVPDGSEMVGEIIKAATNGESVQLSGWQHVNGNDEWIVKPDSTCGLEINSPILRGALDLHKLYRVVRALTECGELTSDRRCSFHVHVNLEDLEDEQIATVMAWWIKCEGTLFASLPGYRKVSRHAQLIGISDLTIQSSRITPQYIIEKLWDVKYHSASLYHMRQKRRRSAEFRIGENQFCLNADFVKNWIRFLLHFVRCSVERGFPLHNSRSSEFPSGLKWLTPEETFRFLHFDQPDDLSFAMQETKLWFLERLKTNGMQENMGLWEAEFLDFNGAQIKELVRQNTFRIPESVDTSIYTRATWV